jgi:hypothetical protein
LATEVAAISPEPIPNEDIAKLEPLVSKPVASEAEVIAPVIEEAKVAQIEVVKEAGIVPAAIEEEKVVEEAEAVKGVAIVPAAVEEKVGEAENFAQGEAMNDFEIVPAAVEEEKAGETKSDEGGSRRESCRRRSGEWL